MEKILLNILRDGDFFPHTWLGLLKTRVKRAGEQYSTILTHPLFQGVRMADDDVLQGLNITEIGTLYEQGLNYDNKIGKKNSGVYYTPEDVANFMTQEAFSFFDNPEKKTWLDPCCGVGNLCHALLKNLPPHVNKEDFLTRQLKLNDLDPIALLTAQVTLTLAYQEKNPHVFTLLCQHSTSEDFLNMTEVTSDVILMNPPYARTQQDSRFITSKAGDVYAYFIEKALSFSPQVVSIHPQSYTHAKKFSTLRSLLLKKPRHMRSYNFDNIPDTIFKGKKIGSFNSNTRNSVRASILFVKPARVNTHESTGLLRWLKSEREELFQALPTLLTPTVFTPEVYPKIPQGLHELYDKLSAYPRLRSLTSPTPTPYVMWVPSTPRYFLSAVVNPLERSSVHKVFFRSAEDRDYALIVVNSLVSYFWWRVHDGGLTLSRSVLLDIPLTPSRGGFSHVIEKLAGEEVTHRVTSLNGGRIQDNVKYSRQARQECGEVLGLSEYYQKLSGLTRNTIFS